MQIYRQGWVKYLSDLFKLSIGPNRQITGAYAGVGDKGARTPPLS